MAERLGFLHVNSGIFYRAITWAALREGLRTGVIDMVATDHAPHADHEKDHPWEDSPFGVTGLEWAAAVVNMVAGLDDSAPV